jgi:GR25 family glycosyltransferase involved in LPS biosynthesis
MVHRISPTYWIHLNDACTFVRRDAYVKRSIDCLTNHTDIHQLLYNRDYVYTYDAWTNIPVKEIEKGVIIHEAPSSNMWALVPGCTRVKALEDIGVDITVESEYTIGMAWNSKAFKTAFLNSISYLCKSNIFDPSHIGFYSEAPHANTFVINLEHRKDRRDDMEIKLKEAGITNFAFVKAVNGKRLAPTKEIRDIFSDNNFYNRRGIIGVALSHYRLWERLIADAKNTHYTIYEDDIVFDPDTLTKLRAIKVPNNDAIIFLGYHIWDSYKSTQPATYGVYPLQNGEYLGGMHAYIITKAAAKTLCAHVKKHGMKLAVDAFCVGSKYGGYVGERCGPNIPCLKVCPPIVAANWVKPGESVVDSDIQYDMDSLPLNDPVLTNNVKWKFIPGLDSFGHDIRYIGRKDMKELLITASSEPGCIAVNTLGYLKHKVNTELIAPSCFGEGDGMFIREQ